MERHQVSVIEREMGARTPPDNIDRSIIVGDTTSEPYLPNWKCLWLCVNISDEFMMVLNGQSVFNVA